MLMLSNANSIDSNDSIGPIDSNDSIDSMLRKVCKTTDFSKLYIIIIFNIVIPLIISTRSAPSRLSRA